jgi:hypothetical protein
MDEHFDLQLDDVVLFELPSAEDAAAFRIRLRPHWPGWSHDDDEFWLFAADLSGAEADLPLLLREAQDVLAERGCLGIRFLLDGRVYELEPAVSRMQAA